VQLADTPSPQSATLGLHPVALGISVHISSQSPHHAKSPKLHTAQPARDGKPE